MSKDFPCQYLTPDGAIARSGLLLQKKGYKTANIVINGICSSFKSL